MHATADLESGDLPQNASRLPQDSQRDALIDHVKNLDDGKHLRVDFTDPSTTDQGPERKFTVDIHPERAMEDAANDWNAYQLKESNNRPRQDRDNTVKIERMAHDLRDNLSAQRDVMQKSNPEYLLDEPTGQSHQLMDQACRTAQDNGYVPNSVVRHSYDENGQEQISYHEVENITDVHRVMEEANADSGTNHTNEYSVEFIDEKYTRSEVGNYSRPPEIQPDVNETVPKARIEIDASKPATLGSAGFELYQETPTANPLNNEKKKENDPGNEWRSGPMNQSLIGSMKDIQNASDQGYLTTAEYQRDQQENQSNKNEAETEEEVREGLST